MPEYHGPEGERFTSEELAREAARPVAARVQGLIAVILSRQAIAREAAQELEARQAREQAEQAAIQEAEAAEKTATRVALQKATAEHMRSEAQAIAQYMTAHGIQPTVTIAKDDKKPAELVGYSEFYVQGQRGVSLFMRPGSFRKVAVGTPVLRSGQGLQLRSSFTEVLAFYLPVNWFILIIFLRIKIYALLWEPLSRSE